MGRVAYVEQGEGPAIVFVHGVPLNGFHWRHVMAGLSDVRRCIAPDLMGLGYTEISAAQDVSFAAQAEMLLQLLDRLGLDRVDLVGNDSGGAISQIFAAKHSDRLRTLTLTNCDVHDGWPPPQVLPIMERSRNGTLAEIFRPLVERPDLARERYFRGESVPLFRSYADPGVLTDEIIRFYLQPLLSSQPRIEAFERYWLGFDNAQTVAIEPALRRLTAPTLIVWGLADIFFDKNWAYWLKETIPGAERVIEVPDGRLFFPEDRAEALTGPMLSFWEKAARHDGETVLTS